MNTAKSACRKGMMLKGNLLTYWQTSFTFIGWICYLGVVDGNVKHSAHTQPDVIGESVKYYALNQTYVTNHSWCDLVINACFVKNEDK